MRILYAVHAYKPAYRVGGPILSVSAAAEMLVRKGHTVTVFTSNSNLDQDLDVPLNRPINVEGVCVWYFERQEFFQRWLGFVPYLSRSLGYLYAPRMAPELERLIPEMDLVHTHMPFVYPTYATARAALRFRKPLFYSQRGVFDPQRLRFRSLKKKTYIGLIERPIMRKATALIALTESELRSYRALGVETVCRIIPNGITVADYRSEPSRSPGSRWSLPAPAQVILFLGRLHPLKGAEQLLQAFLRVHRSFPLAVLVMAGPDEWGLEARFRESIRRAGLSGLVHFPGMVSGEEKLELLARANLFCLPSQGEGFSMAILEALASSTPVLISPGCHFPEVETAGAGRVVAPEPSALADAIESLLAEPESLRSMGSRAREFVSLRYTWEHVIDQLLDVYSDGMERAGRAS